MNQEMKEFFNFIISEIKDNNVFHVLGMTMLLSFTFLLACLTIFLFGLLLLVLPWQIHWTVGLFIDIVFIVPAIFVIYVKFFTRNRT